VDYKKHYDNLMRTRLLLKKERHKSKKEGFYFEGHHIVPKSKGGSGLSTRGLHNDNIVYLTAREHFLAHWLLWRIDRDRSSSLAFHKMLSCNKHQKRNISSRMYEEARLSFSETNKGNKFGKGISRKASIETKLKISKNHANVNGEKNPFYGKNHTIEARLKMSESRKKYFGELTYNYKGLRVVKKENEILATFKTNKEVANFIGCAESNVRHVLSGNQKTARGYKIQYISI